MFSMYPWFLIGGESTSHSLLSVNESVEAKECVLSIEVVELGLNG